MKRILQLPYFHLSIAILSIALLYFSSFFFSQQKPNYTEFNKKLNQNEALAEQTLAEIIQDQSGEFSFSKQQIDLFQSHGLSFYCLENNKIKFWTNRNAQFSANLNAFKANSGVVELQNGWYQYLIKKSHNKTYLALILIKNSYTIKNKYLNNSFHKTYQLSADNVITLTKKDGGFNIHSTKGAYLFTIGQTINEEDVLSNTNWLLLLLFFIAYLFTISFISKTTRKRIQLRKISPVLVILFIVVSRVIILFYQPFEGLLHQELFSPNIFAQSFLLPSLGDLIINAVLFAVIIYYLSRAIQNVNNNNKVIVFLIGALIASAPLVVANLLSGLITNSKINFDINYLLDLSSYSFIGIGAITILFIVIILLTKITFDHFSGKAFTKNQLLTIFWILSVISIIIGHFYLNISAFNTSWVLLIILVFAIKTNPKTSFYRSVIIIFIISITVSYGFIHIGKLKNEINKEFVAKKLAKERDPVTEYLFEDIVEKIKKDTLVLNSANTYLEKKAVVNDHLINKYFGGHFSKYDINIIDILGTNDSIYVEGLAIVHAQSFFKNKIEEESEDPFRINETLNFLYSNEGISSYFATIKLNADKVLYLELFPKVFSKTEGYPELLLNEKDLPTPLNTNTYSFAKYKKGKLIDNTGKFNYSIELSNQYRFNDDGFYKTTFENAYHVIYQNDKNTTIILSSPQKTIFNYITTFSYFFIITSILVLIIGFLLRISPFNWQIALTDFSTKIQLFIIASIFLSFILFSWGTSYYIKKQYLEKNKTQLAEKVQSVLIELEHKLGSKEILTPKMSDEMTYYLIKFSNVFYTDINLYDKTGKLLATSRPEVFEQGLIGKQMSPEAYNQIHIHKKSNFTHSENIGGLKYISTYVPFRNEKHQILAYMNLPYFAKQNELENELSSFYTALINIYGLLFLISTIIAVFFANYISEPVRMIKNKISALQIGQSYDLLEWESNDEIGALVYEYNKKVIELERNAAKLVKSERESAWREMAKQVAHEIKNPLTPMKLSIQQLERVAKDNPADLDERIERTAKTLVEQIDTLTKIADEFSNFAKMPNAEEKELNLIPIIETTIDLYKEDVLFELNSKVTEEVIIIADKDQISRVFSNLIKNAKQAIPDHIEGKIIINISIEENEYLLEIKDNGSGIADTEKDKIFVPNFTTKSTGMGLGLAMVKNIIENANGSIWFETKENIGTSFFLKFPKV